MVASFRCREGERKPIRRVRRSRRGRANRRVSGHTLKGVRRMVLGSTRRSTATSARARRRAGPREPAGGSVADEVTEFAAQRTDVGVAEVVESVAGGRTAVAGPRWLAVEAQAQDSDA